MRREIPRSKATTVWYGAGRVQVWENTLTEACRTVLSSLWTIRWQEC